jgi:hypothetical protein
MIAFMLASCQAVPATPSLQPTATRTALPITVTPTISKKTVTMTLRPSFTPVNTRIPTLSSEQQMTQVSDLLTNNGGCKLPCWWGIVPGETSWETTESILAPLAIDRSGGKIREGDFGAYFNIKYLLNDPSWYDFIIVLSFKDNVVSQIHVYYTSGIKKYNISQLLKEYGKPDEVRLFTINGGNDPRIAPGASLFLFYYNQGFSVYYYSTEGTLKNDIIQACFQKSGYLDIWKPGDANTLLEYGKQIYRGDLEYLVEYRLLEDVTELDMDSFYQIFTSSDNPCLTTDQRIWPKLNQ